MGKFLSYREVIEVIEYCMKDDAAYKFLNSAFDLPANSETGFTFNSKMVGKFKNLNRAMDEERDFHYQSCEVDYDIVKSLIDSSKSDLALSMLNGHIKEAGLSENFKKYENDLPHLIIAAFIHAADDYNNNKEEIQKSYSNKKLISSNGKKHIDKLRQLSASFFNDIEEKRKRYNLIDIDPKLLSKGGLPVNGRINGETKDLTEFMKDDRNLFIYGPGGIGKSSFAFHVLDMYKDSSDYIPFYFSLTELKAFGDDSNKIKSHYFKDVFNKKISELKITNFDYDKILNADYGKTPKVLLLLDGINEISNDNNSYHRKKLMDEISLLSQNKNLRIIATSRPFNNSDAYLPDALHIEATGLNRDTIIKSLRDNDLDEYISDALFDILSIPLFLLMYIKNGKRSEKKQDSKGAILYEYFNSVNTDDYTEAFIQNELSVIDKDIPDFIAPLFDFFFPAVASEMHKNDSFSISNDTMTNMLSDMDAVMINAPVSSDGYYSKYIKSSYMPSEYAKKISFASLQNINVRDIITDRLSFLQRDHKDNYSFIHQHIRDYFAAIMNLNAILIPSGNLTRPYFDAFYHGWSGDVISFMKEIHSYVDTFISVEDILEKLRFFSTDIYRSDIAISNLFTYLSAINDNDLSGFTFDNIDFSKCDFNAINFNNPFLKRSATFNDCAFSEDTFRSPFNQKDHSVFYSFYENKPVEIECVHKNSELAIYISDILSRYLIASYTYCIKDTDLPYCSIITAKFSDDLKHVAFLFSDDNTTLSVLVICDLIIDERTFGERQILFIDDLKDLDVFLFFNSKGDLVVASELLEIKVYSFEQKVFIITRRFDHSKIVDFEGHSDIFFSFIYEQIDDEKYLLFYPSYSFTDQKSSYKLIVLNISTGDIKTSEQLIDRTLAHTFCIKDDTLYCYYGHQLQIWDLDSLTLYKKIDISYRDSFVINSIQRRPKISISDNHIYLDFPGGLIKINIYDLNNIDMIHFDESKEHLIIPAIRLTSNDSYILFRQYQRYDRYLLFRIDQQSFNIVKFYDYGYITGSYLDNTIPVIYTNGQVALINAKNMSLIDTYILRSVASVYYAYDSDNKLLAVSVKPSQTSSEHMIYVFDITDAVLKKKCDITLPQICTFAFDSDEHLLYAFSARSFYVYDMNEYPGKQLLKEETLLIHSSYAEYTDGIIRFFGLPEDEDNKYGDFVYFTFYDVKYADKKIIQKGYTITETTRNTTTIEAARPIGKYHCELLPRHDSSFSDEEGSDIYVHDTMFDPTYRMNNPIASNKIYKPSESLSDKILYINDYHERNYSFQYNDACLEVYEYGASYKSEPLMILYDAIWGAFTHVKSNTLISAFKDNTLFKYDLKKDKCLGSTRFIANINIVNAKINNPVCSDEVKTILKENGADLHN